MDRLHIRKEIAALINSIKEHSDNIGNNEHIPQLELELILHKIEKLYQKSIVFNHLNSLSEAEAGFKRDVLKDEVVVKKEISKSESVKPVETIIPPVDLFGSELPAKTEKTKAEKKIEKKVEPISINKLQKPIITDLRDAIGINDKFQFANNLFDGNMQEYEIAIQQLNTAETIESAMDYYFSLQQLYNWDVKNEVAKRLADIVERRYS